MLKDKPTKKGRPPLPADAVLKERLDIRLTEGDARALRQLSDKARVVPAEIIRRLIRRAAHS